MKKLIFAIALPMLRAVGVQLREADDNDDGNDDLAGAAIEYAADVTEAVMAKRDIPFPPDILLRGGKPQSDESDAVTAELPAMPAEPDPED